MSYFKKISVIAEMISIIYEKNKDNIANIIYIDGGECTGTTTLTAKVSENLSENIIKYARRGFKNSNLPPFTNITKTREPSQECKDTIVKKMIEEGKMINPADAIDEIITVFMSDRATNQKTSSGELKISDRGIFSTFIYQSGILNEETPIEEIVRNCRKIENSIRKYKIKLPIAAVNLVSTDSCIQADIDEFMERLNKRTTNNEQEIDALDNMDSILIINKVYTDITYKLIELGVEGLYPMDFKNSIETNINKVLGIIETI